MTDPRPIRIGCGIEVHRGWIVPAQVTHRGDPMAKTVCGQSWMFAGPPRFVDRDVTCPGCKQAQQKRKAA